MMDESTILKVGQEVRILWGKWENVVGTISAIEHIRGGVFYRVNNDKGERSPNLYGISHLDVIQNTTDEPTVDELKAQVDALVSELAHLQAENERLRERLKENKLADNPEMMRTYELGDKVSLKDGNRKGILCVVSEISYSNYNKWYRLHVLNGEAEDSPVWYTADYLEPHD